MDNAEEPAVTVRVGQMVGWAHAISNACLMLEGIRDNEAAAAAGKTLRKVGLDIREHCVGSECADKQ